MLGYGLSFFAVLSLPAAADSLKQIDDPRGGHVVYGPLVGATSLQVGMGGVLRNVHDHFGDKPQLGRFFQSKSGNSVACFFTVNAKRQDGKKLAGIVIIAMPPGAPPAGAVLYDDADRFGRSAGTLMNDLNTAWRKAARASAPRPSREAADTRTYPAQPLHQATFADNSGSIGIPAGWNIVKSGGGSVQVQGPHGEGIFLGAMLQNVYDPRSPRTAGMIQYMRMAGKAAFVCQYGGDPIEAWRNLLAQYHRFTNTPTPTFEESSRSATAASPYEGEAAVAVGTFDAHDGSGPLRSRVRIGELRPTGAMWALTIERESLPAKYVPSEWPTVVAMVKSYRQNGQEIERQTQLVIDDIHARSAANTALANARSAASDERNASVEAGWDQSAKYNESFENYQLDRSVVSDSEGGHRTLDNSAADSLVRNNPNRYQYVQTPNYLRGIDY